MKLSSVRLFVCPSVPSLSRRTPLRRVCCCGPGGQEIGRSFVVRPVLGSIGVRMWAAPRCQLTYEAEHRLFHSCLCHLLYSTPCGCFT